MKTPAHLDNSKTFAELKDFAARMRSIRAMTLNLEAAIKRCIKDELSETVPPKGKIKRAKAELLELHVKPLHRMIERIIKEI